jgi:hypothetical protein
MMSKPKKPALSKQEFNTAITQLLASHSVMADQLTAAAQDDRYAQMLNALREHDPFLADLILDADTGMVDGYQRIVRYLSSRVDN